jgi:hypothetical protein
MNGRHKFIHWSQPTCIPLQTLVRLGDRTSSYTRYQQRNRFAAQGSHQVRYNTFRWEVTCPYISDNFGHQRSINSRFRLSDAYSDLTSPLVFQWSPILHTTMYWKCTSRLTRVSFIFRCLRILLMSLAIACHSRNPQSL